VTTGLLEGLASEVENDIEFTWRVWGSMEPLVVVKFEKVSLMRCPMCNRPLVAHMILELADAWFHSMTLHDFHWRFNDAGLDQITGGRS